ncbi:MAG: ABC transporter, partial [Deltaproteobacteria bacterium]|nr:ABC transporter [Deltaproteobacteria bacterium]
MSKRITMVKPLGTGGLVISLFLVPLFVKDPYLLHVFILIGVNIVLTSSLRLIAITGQLSLGHGGMMAVGAYTSVLLVTKLALSYWLALPLSGL